MNQELDRFQKQELSKFDPANERRSLKRGLQQSYAITHFKNLDFFVFPDTGFINTEFAINASHFFSSNLGSTDPLQVRYSFDTGDWETDFMTDGIVYHQFKSGGRKNIKMQARRGDVYSEVVVREIIVREGLRIGESIIKDVRFSDNGKHIITLASNRIKVLGIDTGDTLMIGGYEEDVSCLELNKASKELITASFSGKIKVWDILTGELLSNLKVHDGPVKYLLVLNDQFIVTYGDDSFLRCIDLHTNAIKWELHLIKDLIKGITKFPDNSKLIISSEYRALFIVDVQKGEISDQLLIEDGWVDQIAINERNEVLCLVNMQGVQKLFNLSAGIVLYEFNEEPVKAFFDPEANYLLAYTRQNKIKIINIENRSVEYEFYSSDDWIFPNPFFHDKNWLVCRGWDNSLKIYDYTRGSCYAIFLMPEGYVKAAEFHPLEKKMLVGGSDNKIKEWDLQSGKVISSFDTGYVWSKTVAYNLDGRLLAFTRDEKTTEVWSAVEIKFLLEVELPDDKIKELKFLKNDNLLIRCDESLFIYDCKNQKFIQAFEGNPKILKSAFVTNDMQFLISVNGEQEIIVWDLSSGEIFQELPFYNEMPSEIKISESGAFIYVKTENGLLAVYDFQQGQLLWTFGDERRMINSFSFKNDDSMVAVGIKNDILLLSSITGNHITTLEGHDQYVSSIKFHPGKNLLISGSYDHTTKIWSLDTYEVMADLKGGVNVNVSPDGKYLLNGASGEIKIWNIEHELRTSNE